MATTTNSLERKKAEMDEIFKKLEHGVKDVFTSENYQKYLSVMSTFHQYSVNNQLLIMLQRPDAKLVAGYEAWKQKNRQVRAGEKGIRILAPQTYNVSIDKKVQVLENGNIKRDSK